MQRFLLKTKPSQACIIGIAIILENPLLGVTVDKRARSAERTHSPDGIHFRRFLSPSWIIILVKIILKLEQHYNLVVDWSCCPMCPGGIRAILDVVLGSCIGETRVPLARCPLAVCDRTNVYLLNSMGARRLARPIG